jgi:hypothetical protein
MNTAYSVLRFRGALSAAALLAGAAVLGACSSPFGAGTTSDWFPSLPGFSSVKTTSAEPSALAEAPPLPRMDEDCPVVQVRIGSSTLGVAAKTQQPTASDLRYQLTLTQFARQCALAGPAIRMRVGVQGRVLVGPAGAPPQVDVPVRYAVVQEGIQPKTIATKFKRFPVAVPPGAPSVTFTDVEEDLTFPVVNPDVLDSYIVYVGFDDIGDRNERRPPPKKAKAKVK